MAQRVRTLVDVAAGSWQGICGILSLSDQAVNRLPCWAGWKECGTCDTFPANALRLSLDHRVLGPTTIGEFGVTEYETLALTAIANAGTEAFPSGAHPCRGEAVWHGLPFLIGGADTSDQHWVTLLGTGGWTEPCSIEVGRAVEWAIFAHVLADAPRDARETLGATVARYEFEFEGGSSIVAPIRDRFEIAGTLGSATDPFATGWGQLPFAAVTSEKDRTPDRLGGPWEAAMIRQTENIETWRAPVFLWPWRNPCPDRRIERIVLHPTERRLLLCAVTVSALEESPFPREAAREVVLHLTGENEAAQPATLEVDVDRGSAGYPFVITQTDADAFLHDPLAGFGDEPNTSGSPACIAISAVPSATVKISRDGSELGSVRWGELERAGSLEVAGRVRIELSDPGRTWVRTRVVDDATGRPVPCRIHFRSVQGIPFAPHGHHAHVHSDLDAWNLDVGGDLRLGHAAYAYIDGTCEGWLPLGNVTVDVARGFEYRPVRRAVGIVPGQRELELRIDRIDDLSGERWFSGDTHVHFLSTQGSHLEAAGEGLNVVNLLLAQWGSLFTSAEEFTGSPSVAQSGETIVYASQENRQHVLGHLSLLGLKRPVYPWSTDGPDEAAIGGPIETTLSHWADACRAQGGTVVVPHFPAPNGEPAALIATGRADAVELAAHSEYGLSEYYRYLNAGYRLPLAGGTDKMSSSVPVGLFRTYVHLPDEELSYEAWCRGLRAGATFITSGPLLRFLVDAVGPGSDVRLTRNGGTVEVEATARSIFPLRSLEIVQNGQTVLSSDDAQGARELTVRGTLRIDGAAWLAARCAGFSPAGILRHRDCWSRAVMAHTSPVYVRCGEAYAVFDEPTIQYMLTLVEGSLTHIRERTRSYRPPVTHHHGEHDHAAYLERPFQEAFEALHALLHAHGIDH